MLVSAAGIAAVNDENMLLAKLLYYSEVYDLGVGTVPLFDDLAPHHQCRWFEKADWIMAEAAEYIG